MLSAISIIHEGIQLTFVKNAESLFALSAICTVLINPSTLIHINHINDRLSTKKYESFYQSRIIIYQSINGQCSLRSLIVTSLLYDKPFISKIISIDETIIMKTNKSSIET
jgi:hypothetical protein